MPFSGPRFIQYGRPRPFTSPTRDEVVNIPPPNTLIPRETLHYFGGTLEKIMCELSFEYSLRLFAPPVWKLYKTSLDDFEVFQPREDGRNLNRTPVKWFAQYIIDIRNAIDFLFTDSRVPDSRAAFLARVFTNSQGIPRQARWTDKSKLKDNIRVNLNGQEVQINPLTRAQNGEWPFTEDYLKNATTKIGVTANKTVQADLDVPSTDFPQSVIGATTPSGIAGIDVAMTSQNRPNLGDRKQPNPVPNHPKPEVPDFDQGYGYLGHLALTVQSVRWQPPQVEWFPNNQATRFYAPKFFSPTTPALDWILAQPVSQRTLEPQNWGFWLIRGTAGIQGNRAVIKADGSIPPAQEGTRTECPFSVFFPPAVVQCACSHAETAYFVWYAADHIFFKFDGHETPPQNFQRGRSKTFNKHTRLKIKFSGNADPANSAATVFTKNQFSIGVQTSKLGIIEAPFENLDLSSFGSGGGIIDVNLQEAIKNVFPSYQIGGVDQLMALKLQVTSRDQGMAECATVFTDTGRAVPPECFDSVTCVIDTVTANVDYVWLDEQGIQGDPVSAYT